MPPSRLSFPITLWPVEVMGTSPQFKRFNVDFLGQSTGTSGYIHLGLITVMAIGALPDETSSLFIFDNLDLSIPATCLAIVTLGI